MRKITHTVASDSLSRIIIETVEQLVHVPGWSLPARGLHPSASGSYTRVSTFVYRRCCLERSIERCVPSLNGEPLQLRTFRRSYSRRLLHDQAYQACYSYAIEEVRNNLKAIKRRASCICNMQIRQIVGILAFSQGVLARIKRTHERGYFA